MSKQRGKPLIEVLGFMKGGETQMSYIIIAKDLAQIVTHLIDWYHSDEGQDVKEEVESLVKQLKKIVKKDN